CSKLRKRTFLQGLTNPLPTLFIVFCCKLCCERIHVGLQCRTHQTPDLRCSIKIIKRAFDFHFEFSCVWLTWEHPERLPLFPDDRETERIERRLGDVARSDVWIDL